MASPLACDWLSPRSVPVTTFLTLWDRDATIGAPALPQLQLPSGIAYNSRESGRFEIYAQSFPEPGGGKWRISKDGGGHLRWRRDGRELFYYALDGRLMGVPIANGPTLEIGEAVPLFEAHMLGGPVPQLAYRAQWDVAPDGRFLMNVPAEDTTASAINVVVHWTAALKK